MGADLIGLNFYSESPRAVSYGLGRTLRDIALSTRGPRRKRKIRTVAVFVNPDDELVLDVLQHVQPDILQFHGDESPDFCRGFETPFMKAFALAELSKASVIPAYLGQGAMGYLIDAHSPDVYGGSGRRIDPATAQRALREPRGFLAGGLGPDNVEAAVRQLRPFGVDVASGIEDRPGVKNSQAMAAFIAAVERACVD